MNKIITPLLAVDIVINYLPEDKLVLISRKNTPKGYALPGGFVDVGESTMDAAVREAQEETGCRLSNVRQFHTYSKPSRDPRGHTVSVVYLADTLDYPIAADDAKGVGFFYPTDYKAYSRIGEMIEIVFDHSEILMDVVRFYNTGELPR
jgi:8-oxo-dGTP diphosphatase